MPRRITSAITGKGQGSGLQVFKDFPLSTLVNLQPLQKEPNAHVRRSSNFTLASLFHSTNCHKLKDTCYAISAPIPTSTEHIQVVYYEIQLLTWLTAGKRYSFWVLKYWDLDSAGTFSMSNMRKAFATFTPEKRIDVQSRMLPKGLSATHG